MGEVIPYIPVRWTVLASAFFHAGVALLLAFKISSAPSLPVVPVGVEMVYLGEIKAPAAPAVKIPVPARAKPAVQKASNEPAQVKAVESPTVEAAAQPAATGPAGAKDGAVVSALERYKFELRQFLESRKIYPETAKRLRQTGKVVVNFKISAIGDLSEVSLEQASASEVLNRAAVELVKSAPRFKPFPEAAVSLNEMKLSLPIEYIL